MSPAAGRLRALTDEYRELAARLREGGGSARVAKMHQQGKLAPRERVDQLLDPARPGWSWAFSSPTISTKVRRRVPG